MGSWSTAQSTRSYESDDGDDEEHEDTSPLRSDALNMPAVNGNGKKNGTVPSYSPVPPSQGNWLVRLLRFVPTRGD